MDAPKCRICGEREWNHSCLRLGDVSLSTAVGGSASPVAGGAGRSATEQTARSVTRPFKVSAPTEAGSPDPSVAQALSPIERTQRWRSANRERYNAYMRQYMRKRRG